MTALWHKFLNEWRAELRRRVQSDPAYDWPDKSEAAIESCIQRMVPAIHCGAVSFAGSPALRAAARRCGITSTKALKTLFTENEVTA